MATTFIKDLHHQCPSCHIWYSCGGSVSRIIQTPSSAQPQPLLQTILSPDGRRILLKTYTGSGECDSQETFSKSVVNNDNLNIMGHSPQKSASIVDTSTKLSHTLKDSGKVIKGREAKPGFNSELGNPDQHVTPNFTYTNKEEVLSTSSDFDLVQVELQSDSILPKTMNNQSKTQRKPGRPRSNKKESGRNLKPSGELKYKRRIRKTGPTLYKLEAGVNSTDYLERLRCPYDINSIITPSGRKFPFPVKFTGANGKSRYKCPVDECSIDFVACHIRYLVENHLERHATEFVCKVSGCGKTFPTEWEFEGHLSYHDNRDIVTANGHRFPPPIQQWSHDGREGFACPVEGCDLFSPIYPRVVDHLNEHAGCKPYTCTYEGCDKSFSGRSSLKLHLKIHDKKFECLLCGKKLPDKQTLKKHLQSEIHVGYKQFKCPFCPAAYDRSESLSKHKKQKHSGAPDNVECRVCGKTLTRSYLKEHMMKQHQQTLKGRPYGSLGQQKGP